MSRGHTEEEAMGMIVNGFFNLLPESLPMEYAVELNRLLELRRPDWMTSYLDATVPSRSEHPALHAMVKVHPGA